MERRWSLRSRRQRLHGQHEGARGDLELGVKENKAPLSTTYDASGVFVLLKGRGVGEELGVEDISGRGASFQEQLKSVQDQRRMDTRLPLPRAAAETDVVCTV